MILYHGTNVEFEKIDLLKSKPNKDFGRGFYLSPFFEQAKDMAETKVEQLEYGNPIVFQYEVKEEDMADLRILRFDSYSEEWAKFILANRNNKSEKAVQYMKGVTIQYFFGTERAINILRRV